MSNTRSLLRRHLTRSPLVIALVVGLVGLWPGEARAGRSKLDTRLQALVDAGSTATQRVIVRAQTGKRAALKTRLAAKKEPVLRESRPDRCGDLQCPWR